MNIDDYIHRIGRTGRLGKKGSAVTFIEKGDKIKKFCCDCDKKIKVRNERCMICSKNGKNNPFQVMDYFRESRFKKITG